MEADKVIARMRALGEGATARPLDIGVYPDDADPVEMHREFLSYGSGPVWLVWAPNHPATVGTRDDLKHAAVVCVTGNGPTSEANARAIIKAMGLWDLVWGAGGLVEAGFGIIEQIECELGPCDGSRDSRLWPTANDLRQALTALIDAAAKEA